MKIKGELVGVALVSLLLAGSVGFVGSAEAAPTYSDCAANIADNVVTNAGCEVSSADQEKTNTLPITVNDGGGFFSITSWTFANRDNSDDNTDGNLFGLDQGTLSGSWSISSLIGSAIPTTATDVLAVFKDGSGTTLVGYLLNAVSGTWSSPFECPPFVCQNTKNVSHVSLYYTTDGPDEFVPVPVPGALSLLLSGLAALGYVGWRRQRWSPVA